MFNHASVGVADLDRAGRFYDACFAALSYRRTASEDFGPAWGLKWPGYWATLPHDGHAASAGNGTHVAVIAGSRAAVDAFHAAGLAHGGTDAGPPGERAYVPHYYAAVRTGPDGNKVEAVHLALCSVPDPIGTAPIRRAGRPLGGGRPRLIWGSMAKLTTLYNGACPICRAEIDHYRRYAGPRALALDWTDISVDTVWLDRLGVDRDAVKKRLHVVAPDGRVHVGVDAFAALWAEMPRYRWLYRLVRAPLVKQAAAALYDHVLAPALFAWNRRRGR